MTILASVDLPPFPTLVDSAKPFPRRSWPVHVGLGLARGVAIGVAARTFMRLLSGDPEFTLSGTLFIIGLFTIFGTMQGVVAGTRARNARRRFTAPVRFLGGFSYLILGLGAGIIMAPFLWTMGPALAHREWHRRIRIGLAAVAALNLIGVIAMQMNEEDFRWVHIVAFALLLATYLAAAWTAGPTFASANSAGTEQPA